MRRMTPASVQFTFAEFHARFLTKLKSRHKAKPLITMILGDKALCKQCASMLWPCVNGSTAEFVAISKKWKVYWNSEIKAALVELQNLRAVENVYTNLNGQPDRLRCLTELRSDLQHRLGKRMVLKSKAFLGRDQDWTVVLHARQTLEPHFGGHLPDATLAALLNAARAATGQKEKNYSAAAVRAALKRTKASLHITK